MIIECSYCKSKVDGKIICEHVSYGENDPFPFKTVLLECPVCNNSLIGCQELIDTGPDTSEWITGNRLWPEPKRHLSFAIPDNVQDSLDEANKCYGARAYSATAVMCGRALEGMCKEFGAKSQNIYNGLQELREKEIIDDRLFQWGEVLREHRNLGAHATEEVITKEDAKDLLEFVNAICDYVFVLSEKFNRFMERKSKRYSQKNLGEIDPGF